MDISSTRSVVMAVHEGGRGPLIPESPLTLSRVNDSRADQGAGRLPVKELSRERSRLAREESAEYWGGRGPFRPELLAAARKVNEPRADH